MRAAAARPSIAGLGSVVPTITSADAQPPREPHHTRKRKRKRQCDAEHTNLSWRARLAASTSLYSAERLENRILWSVRSTAISWIRTDLN